jgi:hypothetical protein
VLGVATLVVSGAASGAGDDGLLVGQELALAIRAMDGRALDADELSLFLH